MHIYARLEIAVLPCATLRRKTRRRRGARAPKTAATHSLCKTLPSVGGFPWSLREAAMVDSEEAVAEALLKAVGADDHEPEVVGMVLDAMHRAARDALGDARDLALHRNETKIEAHDVRAGDDLNAAAGYSRRPPPARENAIAAAASVNAAPLSLADGHGVRLPSEGNLTTRGYSLEARNDDLESMASRYKS